MKCKRLKCDGAAAASKRGFCDKHHKLALLQSGRPMGLVDAEPVIAHVSRLRNSGLSLPCICRCSGVSKKGLDRILRGDSARVQAYTAQRLMTVRPIDVLRSDDCTQIPSLGTVRRLRALQAIGYSARDLAERLGCSPQTVGNILAGKSFIWASMARKTAAVFSALEATPAPRSLGGARAINRARKLGWAVPLRWNEDEIDDPDARPIKTYRLDTGWLPEYEKLSARGYSNKKIAALMDIHPTSLNSRVRRSARAA